MDKLDLKTNYKLVENVEKNGVELYFDSIPNKKERELLKNNGYKWHNLKKCWYKSNNYKVVRKSDTKEKAKTNAYGVKVGDVFFASWGYEQTNNDFFRVKELRGSKQVIVQEVCLGIVEQQATGPDARDVKYDPKDWAISSYSSFIKDNEKGEAKLVQISKYNNEPYIKISSFANAYLYQGEKVYNSWYY